MKFAHRAGFYRNLRDSDLGGDVEDGRIDDFDRAAVELRCVHLRHVEHERLWHLSLGVRHWRIARGRNLGTYQIDMEAR